MVSKIIYKYRNLIIITICFLIITIIYLLHKSRNKKIKAIVIGDSQTPFINKNTKTTELLGESGNENNLWKSGVNLSWLIDSLIKYPTNNKITHVVISIGTNGGFSVNDKIDDLFKVLREKFPKAKYIVVKGSWGWGNNKNISEEKVNNYYQNFSRNGAVLIKTPIGNVKDPHTNLLVYKKIGKEIDNEIF